MELVMTQAEYDEFSAIQLAQIGKDLLRYDRDYQDFPPEFRGKFQVPKPRSVELFLKLANGWKP